LKNEATDLVENKGSAFDGIRNEATVEGSRQKAVGWHQIWSAAAIGVSRQTGREADS